jgi:hypothetical protein
MGSIETPGTALLLAFGVLAICVECWLRLPL